MTKRQTVVGPACQATKHELDVVSEGTPREVSQQESGGVVFVLWQNRPGL